MRKDLKIGMAIGAVLLVVLIVYLAVPKSGDTDGPQNTEVTLDTGEESAVPPGDTSPPSKEPDSTREPAVPEELQVAGGEDVKKDIFEDGNDWGKILDTGELPPLMTSATPPPNPEAQKQSADENSQSPPSDEKPEAQPTEPKWSPADPETAAPVIEESSSQSSDAGRSHKIQRGENYSSIAKLVYGDARHYLAIQRANPTLDPARLRPGSVINLPDSASIKAVASSSNSAAAEPRKQAENPIDSENEYRVQSGDSLYKIAIKRYNSSNMVQKLYEANKQTIGDDSARLKVGMVLKLPPNPSIEQSVSR